MAEVAGTSVADVSPILKDWYVDNPVDYAIARQHKLFTLMTKNQSVSGKAVVQPLTIGGATPYVDFGTAQTNQVPIQDIAFNIPMLPLYTPVTVSGPAMEASRNDRGAFFEVFKRSTDVAMENQILSDAWSMYRTGTGSIGSITGTLTTGAITLLNATDGVAFYVGQVLTASTTDGGGTVRAGLGYVISVDIIAGNVLVSATAGGAAGTPSGWATGDFLYPQSGFNAQISGVGAWLPALLTPSGATNPLRPLANGTAVNFLGANRAVDPVRTAGISINVSNESVSDGLTDLLSAVRAVGKGDISYVFVNPQTFRALDKDLQSRRRYENLVVTADITYEGMRVDGALVLQDVSCPAKIAYALDMSTWFFDSEGPNPALLDYGMGVPLFRPVSGADALEARIRGLRNVRCSNPGKNGVALLSE